MFDLINRCKIVDLSHELSSDVPTWSGECGFGKDETLQKGTCDFRIQKINCIGGIGTHMDAPFHCFENAESIEKISLKKCITPVVSIDVRSRVHSKFELSVQDLRDFENTHGKIDPASFVIITTGWSKYWKNSFVYRGGNEMNFPTVSEESVQFLMDRNIHGLGVDTLSPDGPESSFPAHRILLSSGCYIVENIFCPERLPPKGALICALPLPIQQGTEGPLRLIALV